MNKEEKRKTRLQISKVLDENCKGCDVVPKDIHSNRRNTWCLANCSISKSLKELGEKLVHEGRTFKMAEEKNGINYVRKLRSYGNKTCLGQRLRII